MDDSLEAEGPVSLEIQPWSDGEGLARFEQGSLEVLVLDLELPDPQLDELTETECAIAMLVLEGATNAEIAEERDVSVRTVANQLRSIFQKLDVCSRWDLTLLMTRRALEAQPGTGIDDWNPADREPVKVVYNSPETVEVLRGAYGRFGVDFEAALRRHDVIFRDDGAIPRDAYCALYAEVAEKSGVPGFGFELARHLPRGTLGLVEWIAFSCRTLGEAFEVTSTYGELLHPGADRRTTFDAERIVVAYDPQGIQALPVLMDLSFGYAARMFRDAAAGVPPIEVHMPYPDPGHTAAEDHYGCPVIYDADCCRLVFSRELGDVQLENHDPEVFELFRTLGRLQAGKLHEHAVVYETWAAINQSLRAYETPRLRDVTRALDTSGRTLQRRLGAADLSFTGLVSAARLQRALVALRNGDCAGMVGESDAVVIRAFERVAGLDLYRDC